MYKRLPLLLIVCFVPAIFAQTGAAPLQMSTVTLTSAQLLHLKSTPVQIAPAPGQGAAINVIAGFLQYKFNTTPYTNPAGGRGIEISLSGENASFLNGPSVGLIDQAGNRISQLSQGGPIFSQSNAENAPLIIRNADGADWINGDGTLTVTVYYTVVPLQ